MSEEAKTPDNSSDGTQVETVEIPEQFINSDGSTNVQAMAKSYEDARKGMNAAFAERDSLKKELENQSTQEKLVETLESVKEAVKPKEEKPPSFEEYAKNWAENRAAELGVEADDPSIVMAKEAMVEAAKAAGSWNKQDLDEQEKRLDAKLAELDAKLGASEVSRIESSAEYIAHKDEIEGMVAELGIDKGKATDFVLKKYANQSETGTPPPGTPSGHQMTEPAKSGYWKDATERQQFVSIHGEEKAVAMETNYAKRVERTNSEVAI